MEEQIDIQQLITVALAGKHKGFDAISSYSEFLTAKQAKKAINKVAIVFKHLYNQTFNEYIKLYFKLSETDKLDKLITARNMNICNIFYTQEVNLLNEKINEYRAYLRNPANFTISKD